MRATRSGPVSPSRQLAYALRQESGRLLFRPEDGRKQKYRVCHCGRSLNGNFMTVSRAPDGSRASLTGAMMCGSAWVCPICAWKIAGQRQAELEYANVAWVKAGGFVHLLTLTFPHESDETLADLLHAFDKARQGFRNRAAWKNSLGTEGAAGCLGTVSSLEVTHGGNGWHPHLHLLAFTRRPLTEREIAALQKSWTDILLKFGLGDRSKITAMMEHALDVRGGADAAAYITKYGREEMWGLSQEMTGDVAKEAKGGNLKPFGLLRRSVEEGCGRSAALFREFAEGFHGKRLLTWSKGLKEWFGITDLEDDDLVQRPEVEASQLVGLLNAEQWKIVLSRNAVAELERYAAEDCLSPENGQRDLDDFVAWLAQLPAKSGGWFWQPMRRRYLH